MRRESFFKIFELQLHIEQHSASYFEEKLQMEHQDAEQFEFEHDGILNCSSLILVALKSFCNAIF